MTPLLTVIIPTYNRPVALQSAIDSALKAAPVGDVEVIVVPNGPCDSWKIVAQNGRDDRRIKWFPLKSGNACAARNHGLAMSSGKYVRFLDDDDVLLPSAAVQIEILAASESELSLAPLKISFGSEQVCATARLPAANDLVVMALLSIWGSFITEGAIFLRSSIIGHAWPEDATLYDDYIWLLTLVKEREWNWIKFDDPVAVYVQHFGDRLSFTKRSAANSKRVVESILDLHRSYRDESKISKDRVRATSTALLTLAHSAFPASPVYLSRIIAKAHRICGRANPSQPIFQRYPWLANNLVAAEWTMLPFRYISRGYRRASWGVRRLMMSGHER